VETLEELLEKLKQYFKFHTFKLEYMFEIVKNDFGGDWYECKLCAKYASKQCNFASKHYCKNHVKVKNNLHERLI